MTAEQQLRRHGLSKMTVVDIARAAGMSHSNVYRFFPTKAAIFDGITQRWLSQAEKHLALVVAREVSAALKLEDFVIELHRVKRQKFLTDPEIFATYYAVAKECNDVVQKHLTYIHSLLFQIINEGIQSGEFQVTDAEAAASVVRSATLRFHHPVLVIEDRERDVENEARAVMRLLIAGLKTRVL
ncbi:TetR/AcrR family transcriptional regulator [Brasilonema bromeliae SPC951]|uniref:TetR/AcrR family transcriptional regulator n=2 Tax=Bromeliae group (in: Brasilonema) TaxID=3398495 RepID=A0ABX1P720_9CYAN|nr:TetR family transcriptional regulator [Brasilonema bromeliae]NMG19307.1 TetR/AcrR family transcriptional regulator [Brasilonema bromeliae SPC951]